VRLEAYRVRRIRKRIKIMCKYGEMTSALLRDNTVPESTLRRLNESVEGITNLSETTAMMLRELLIIKKNYPPRASSCLLPLPREGAQNAEFASVNHIPNRKLVSHRTSSMTPEMLQAIEGVNNDEVNAIVGRDIGAPVSRWAIGTYQ